MDYDTDEIIKWLKINGQTAVLTITLVSIGGQAVRIYMTVITRQLDSSVMVNK